MVEQSSDNSMIGWRAKAGSLDIKELISEFQSALSDELDAAKKLNAGKKSEIYDGKRIYKSKGLSVYRFQNDDPTVWRMRRAYTQMTITIEGEPVDGCLVSSDPEGVNIGLESDLGDLIEEASVQDSAFQLLENLMSKLERVKSGATELNIEGSMKLFGFQKPNSLPNPISLSEQKTVGFDPNVEQQIAILKSMNQEVTFIWGPPGTGKTKTLGSILNILIRAGRSVLLTANTNSAVDEILKKFIENRENAPLIQAGKIVRLGIPTVQDGSFDEILPGKIVERQNIETEKHIEELQSRIDQIQETINNYEQIGKIAIERKAQRDSLIREYTKVDEDIQFLLNRIKTARINAEQTATLLSNELKLLEKAKTTSLLKRVFLGLNKEQIEAEIKPIETKHRILKLELQSLQKELNDYVQKKDSISARIDRFGNEIEQSVDGITTLEILRKRTLDLNGEAESKRDEISALQTQLQQRKDVVFNEALVIGSTLARASLDPKISKRKFDVLILDEASMAPLPNLFFLAGLCSSHYIVSGDFRQLSPISVSKSSIAQKWLKRDIFAQAGIVESVDANIDDDRLVMLREQYRMHPSICALISEVVYGGKLKTPEHIATLKEKLAELPPFEGKALIFCDTCATNPYITRPKNSFSRISPYSAAISTNLALKCAEGEENGSKVKVGIVTPYRAQAKLISKMLEDKNADCTRIVASTIHSFQGSERDCIIFDLVEGEPLTPGKLTQGTFKNSEPGRLINVAISRAIGKFILIGNSEYVKLNFWITDAIPQVMEKIGQNGETVDSRTLVNWSLNDDGSQGKTLNGLEISDSSFTVFNETNFYDAFMEDLKKAKFRVVIFSPFITHKRVATLVHCFEGILKKDVSIYVVTRNPGYLKENKTEVEETLKELERIGVKVIKPTNEIELAEQFHYKFAVIDNAVFYYGSLNILSQFKSSDSMMAFRSKKTVAQLMRNFGITKIIIEYENQKATNSSLSIIQTIGTELQKNITMGNCPICREKFEFNHDNDGFYFACSNKAHEEHYRIEIDSVKKAVASLKIKCNKCSSGQMVLRYRKESNPFLGCTQYRKSNCQSTLQLHDKYY